MSVSPKKALWIRFYTIYQAYEAIGLRDEYFYCITDLEIFCVLNFKTVFEAFLTKFSERYNPTEHLNDVQVIVEALGFHLRPKSTKLGG